MNPLLTQKIEWGVRLKNDEIVGERTASTRERRSMVVVRGKEKGNALADPLSVGRQMPRLSHGLIDTDTRLARSRQIHLRYFLSIGTLFSSTHPPAIGRYHHYPSPRSKTVVATLRVRSTANGAGARFPQPGHPRWSEQVETCRTSR
jgi:hypothetical protein